ncbi:MAG: aminotransferase-like domain-containing protein [Acidimicrobiales bacterium]
MGNAAAEVAASRQRPRRGDELLSSRARGATSSVIRDLLQLADRPGMLSLAGGLPAPELLPVARIAAATDRVLASYGPRALQYAPTEGMADLREIVAARTATVSTGAPVQAGEVIITTGSQQGLDLVARALCDPGDVVVVESPGYLGALQAFQASGARLVGVATDAHGIRVDALEDQLTLLELEGAAPKIVYVVANFQNPSGATLTLDRRHRLLELAERFGFVLVEDDPYGALRFRGDALPDLRALAATDAQGPGRAAPLDRVVSLGTVSKIVSPGLRVAWIVAPEWLRPVLVRAKQATDLHTSPLTQLIAADLLADEPFMADHIDQIRSTYRERADALSQALGAELGDRIDVGVIDGGMFCWGRLTGDVSATDLFAAAIDAGVAFVPGDAFCLDDSGRAHLRLCFTTLTPSELAVASSRLATALTSLT